MEHYNGKILEKDGVKQPKSAVVLYQQRDASCKECNCYERKESTKEGLADLADMAERDYEVQMARSDLYKIAKYAIKPEMMKM